MSSCQVPDRDPQATRALCQAALQLQMFHMYRTFYPNTEPSSRSMNGPFITVFPDERSIHPATISANRVLDQTGVTDVRRQLGPLPARGDPGWPGRPGTGRCRSRHRPRSRVRPGQGNPSPATGGPAGGTGGRRWTAWQRDCGRRRTGCRAGTPGRPRAARSLLARHAR